MGAYHPNGARPDADDPRFDQWDATLAADDNPKAVTATFPILRSAVCNTVDAYVVTTTLPPTYRPPATTDVPAVAAPSDSLLPDAMEPSPTTAPVVPLPSLVHLPTVDEYRTAQHQDSAFAFWYSWLETHQTPAPLTPDYVWWRHDRDSVTLDDRGLLMRFTSRRQPQLLIPSSFHDRVLFAFHGLPCTTHLGFNRTYARLLEYCYWPHMAADLRTYLATCSQCQGVKSRRQHDLSDLGNLSADYPNDLVVIDCAGPLRPSATGNRYLILMVDHFSKYLEVAAVPRISADVIAQTLLHVWICRYGPMRRLLSDRGSEFANHQVVFGLSSALGVDKIFTQAYHPQGDGVVERAVRTVKSVLTAMCDTQCHLDTWDQHLDILCLAYNSTTHATTGAAPFFIWFGRPPPLPAPLVPLDLADSSIPASAQAYRLSVVQELLQAYDLVRANTAATVARRHEQHAASSVLHMYSQGDLVWLHTPAMAAKAQSRKMCNPWQGPYLVMSMPSSAKQITLLTPRPDNARFQQTVSVARLRPYTTPLESLWFNHGTGWRFPYSVYQRRINDGKEEFHVRWLALKPTPDSWIDGTKLPEHVKQSFWRHHRSLPSPPLPVPAAPPPPRPPSAPAVAPTPRRPALPRPPVRPLFPRLPLRETSPSSSASSSPAE